MSLKEFRYDLSERLGRLFYPVAIAAVLLVLVAVDIYIGPEAAVFGLYALMGLGTGAAVHYGTYDVDERIYVQIDERLHRAGVYAASAVAIGVVALTDEPLFVVFGLAVGYTLVVRQLFAEPTPERVVPQLTALFLLSPITKYLTSGWYVGHGDLLDHTRYVQDIMVGGSLEALSYTSYQQFPGLQLVGATVGSLAGLGAYDGLMLTGLAAYTVLIPGVYLVVSRITGQPLLAVYTAFAVTILDDISFYASYVFPQALATILVLLLVVLLTLRSDDAVSWQTAGAFVLVTGALALTHHLTQALFLPLVVLALGLYVVQDREHATSVLLSRKAALGAFAVAVTAVRYVQTGFIGRLVEEVGVVVQGGLRGGYTQDITFAYGVPPRSSTAADALAWLGSAYGLYLVLLLMVFSVAVVAFLYASNRPAPQTALFWSGVVGAVLIFETPLSIRSLIRVRSPWLFVFAFVIGVGILELRRRIGSTTRSRLLLAGLVVLASTGPLVAADNYYGLDPRPTEQTSFSEAEVGELQAMATYLSEQDGETTTLWFTRLAMERSGIETMRNPELDGESLAIPAGRFAYREAWADHKVTFNTGEGERAYGSTLYISEGYLDERVASSNKVYSAGGTGVTWQSERRTVADQ